MKCSKKILGHVLLLVSMLVPLMAGGQSVTKEAAIAKAAAFVMSQSKNGHKSHHEEPKLEVAIERSELYVINDHTHGGYVVVSGDERLPSILGFSSSGMVEPGNMPCNMRAWLEDYAAQVNYLREHPDVKVYVGETSNREVIPPLLGCNFGQGTPYNNMCPVNPGNGQQCVTGCVATAMAQIMYSHRWPAETLDVIPGYGTTSLSIGVPNLPITAIDWDNILSAYNPHSVNYTEEQATAVATLMLLCGASVHMDYGESSGALSEDVSAALRDYFAYNSHLERRSDFLDDDWEQLLYDELKNGRPVYYSGSSSEGGHAFVFDGYGYDDVIEPYFHINWGWDGYEDNYYLLTSVGDFNHNQLAIMGIEPALEPVADRVYAVKENKKTITFYCDDQKDLRTGEVIPELMSCKEQKDITKCVIDTSFHKVRFKSLKNFFAGCNKLQSIEGLENINTSETLSLVGMFGECSALTALDMEKFTTPVATDMTDMFIGCSSLTTLDLSNFDTSHVRYMWAMFENCVNLQTIYASDAWSVESVEDGGDGMFFNCYMLCGEQGTRFNYSHTGVDYAHVDGGSDNPGYFTYKQGASITAVTADAAAADVYRLDGVKVRTAAQGLAGLSPGIYIVGNKKIVIL